MMKKKEKRIGIQRQVMNVLCLAAAVAFTLLTIVATLDFQNGAKRRDTRVVGAETGTASMQATEEAAAAAVSASDGVAEDSSESPAFILRAYEGKIAVFRPDEVEPLEVLDIYLNTLPNLDIMRLEAGVSVADQDQLLRYLEDFDS